MNNYYFLVLLHHILLYHLCICLPSHYLLLHPNNHNNNNNETPTNQYCQQNMTYGQIVALLSKTRCSSIKEKTPVDINNNNNNNNNRHKRDVNAGTNDIRALQTTVNDHRSMIEYLINNSINATFVSEAINHYHNSTAPTLTSWRDLVDLLFIALVLLALLYFLIFRAGFSKCDKALVYIFLDPFTIDSNVKTNINVQQHHQHQRHNSQQFHQIKSYQTLP